MKTTWVFLLAVGAVAADVSSLGYHYKVPETSYGVPSFQIGGNTGQYSTSYASTLGSGSNSGYAGNLGSSSNSGYTGSLGSGSNVGSVYQGAEYQGTGYQTSGLQSTSTLGSGLLQSSGVSSGSAGSVPAYLYGNSGLNSGYQSQYSSSQYQAAEQQYEVQQQPAQVFKHFYVHSAPEEPEPPKPRAPIVLPPPQKHYKIIFVKTPTESHRSKTVIPVQPQNEEKTIVYVLVKKPEEEQEVIVPKVEQKPPSKPEVFFIKYKNKDDPQAVINNIVKDYDGQQVSILNPGLGDSSISGISGIDGLDYNSAPVVSDVAYNSAVKDVSYNNGASLSDVSYNNGASLGNTYSSASGFGNVQYDAPVQNVVSSSSQSFGDQGSSYSLASGNSGEDLSEANFSSTISSVSPVTISTTASSVDFNGASAIATSQGVPHETYGPPKFRSK